MVYTSYQHNQDNNSHYPLHHVHVCVCVCVCVCVFVCLGHVLRVSNF
jgi:hypothetical protein